MGTTNGINNTVGGEAPGITNTLTVTNSSNTADSGAREIISVEGSSAGDPAVNFNIVGTTDFTTGIDNSDEDTLKISASSSLGTNDRWRLTSSGIRNMPLQPAFRADAELGDNNNITGNGTFATINFSSTVFDQSNVFNVGTNKFIVPVDGIYFIGGNLLLSGISSSHNSSQLEIHKNGTLDTRIGETNCATCRTSSNTLIIEGSTLTFLNASDTITLVLFVAGGAKTITVEGWLVGTLMY